MSDILFRLRRPFKPSDVIGGLFTEAADEIERLRAALKPLARVATNFQWVRDKGLDQEGVFVWAEGRNQDALAITVGDAFRAVEALEQEVDRITGEKDE